MEPGKEDPMLTMFESILFGVNDAIASQEKRGQNSFVSSEVLPRKCNYCSRHQLERMGIKFHENMDDLFVYVTLPDGWKKVATDHSMWSNLIDNKGRIRASIFYKAAFYDRDAHISLNTRYSYGCEPIDGWSDPDYNNKEWHTVITDCGKVIRELAKMSPKPYKNDNAMRQWYDQKNKQEAEAEMWMDKHYPKHEDPLAYWD